MKWTMILTMTKMDETPVKYGLTASLRRWHTMSNSNKCWRHMVPVAVAEGWGGNSLEINWESAHSLEINWKCAHSLEINWKSAHSLEINWKSARRSLSQYDLLNNTQHGGILSSNPLFAILLVLVKIAQHYWPCSSKWRGRERFFQHQKHTRPEIVKPSLSVPAAKLLQLLILYGFSKVL